MIQELYPLLFSPQEKPCAWGKESWLISTVPLSVSMVTNGTLAGAPLDELVRLYGHALMGTKAPQREEFPLLFKILTCTDRASIQVHPGPEAAIRLGGRPKHEMWYFLETSSDSKVVAGLTPGATAENYLEHLQTFQVQRGDLYDIKHGTCHSLMGHTCAYEVQQTSNTTYRLYDWGRPRPLQVKEALASLAWDEVVVPNVLPTEDFTFQKMTLSATTHFQTTAESFAVLFCACGVVLVRHPLVTFQLRPNQATLIPASKTVELIPGTSADLLVTTLSCCKIPPHPAG